MPDDNFEFAAKHPILALSIVAGVFFAFNNPAWVDEPGAQSLLEKDPRFKEVTAKGYSWFSCSSAPYATKFNAVTTTGDHVSGTVCKSLFLKESTIRYDDSPTPNQ